MPTVASENLLKAILELDENGEQVIAARLADLLHISSAAVSMALKRLQRKKQLRISKQHTIRLSPAGFRLASDLVRRHRLIERLLTDVLHMPWEKVHDEAEKLEHAISPELERRMLELFGKKGTCPHGSSFTLSVPSRRDSQCFRLKDAAENSPLRVVRIAEVHEREKDFLNSLAKVGLKPGSRLTLLRKTFDGILELRVGERKATFSSLSGAMIWVESAPGKNHPIDTYTQRHKQSRPERADRE